MTFSSRQLRLVAAFVGLNIVLAVGAWMTVISPQRHDAAAAAAAAQLAQSQLDALTPTSSQGSSKQPEIHTADLYTLDTALPSQADQPDLLLELDRVAKASGVKVIGISPQVGQAVGSGYTVVPINLQLDGSYFKLTDFLRNLRTLVVKRHGLLVANGPLFAVTSVAISPATDGDAPATVQMEAFYYGVTAGATPPVNTTATDTTTTTGS